MSSIKPQQILMPQKVHIGDSAELRLTFTSPSTKLENLVKTGSTTLSTSIFQEPIDSDIFEVSSITLLPSGNNNYQLSIIFTPWKTGVISFPPLKIEDVNLTLKSEEIVSLTKSLHTSSLQESAAPLLLPGTTYKLYAGIIGLVIFLILVIILIIKRKKVSFFMKNRILLHKYKKNKRQTQKSLNILLDKENLNDKECGEEIQRILRHYLEVRFNYNFSNVVTSRLGLTFSNITQNLLSDEKYEAFGEIVSSFIRTDYIRYSKESNFLDNEKKELISKINNAIETLEGEDKSDD